MKQLFSLVAFLLLSIAMDAQTYFKKTFSFSTGETGFFNTMVPYYNGRYLLLGETVSVPPGHIVTMIDSTGDPLWAKRYELNTNAPYAVSCVTVTPDSCFLVVSPIGSTTTDWNIFLFKINASGDTLWTRNYGNSSGNEVFFSISFMADGNYLIAGQINAGMGTGTADILLIKVDPSGNLIWSKNYGGTLDEVAYTSIAEKDSGAISFGWTKSFGAGGDDLYLLRTDKQGNIVWTKTYGTSLDNTPNLFCFIKTSDNGYLVGANSRLPNQDVDVIALKLDSLGNLIWQREIDNYYNIFNVAQEIHGVMETHAGHFILIENIFTTQHNIFIDELNASGQVIRVKQIEYANPASIWEQADGEFMLCGYTDDSAYHPMLILTDSAFSLPCSIDKPVNSFIPALSSGTGGIGSTYVITYVNSTIDIDTIQLQEITECSAIVSADERFAASTFFRLYPNPFPNKTILTSGNLLQDAELCVFNYYGQILQKKQHLQGQTIEIEREELSPGMYILQLKEKNTLVATMKMVISQ